MDAQGDWISAPLAEGERMTDDALEAPEKVFAKLRQILVSEKPDVEYFSVDLRVASGAPIPRP